MIAVFFLMILLLTACAGDSTPVAEPQTAPLATPPAIAHPPTATVEEALTPITNAICVAEAPNPTPPAEIVEIFSPQEEDWSKGPEDAAVTIVEYADFQCPYCATAGPVLLELQSLYPNDVRFIYRHFPLLAMHDKSILAAQAAEAAGLQGEFWGMHDLLYAKQAEWGRLSIEDFKTWVIEQTETLDINSEQFTEDFESEEITQKAQETWEKGQEIGFPGTPFIMINYQQFKSQPKLEILTAIVEMIKLEKRQFTQCPPMTIDPENTYIATLETEKGNITIELFPDVAPMAVNSFIFLAENGWFDDITFHRVIPDFVAQTGDPAGTGYGSPGYSFGIETDSSLTFDRAGLVAMANSGPDANGSQFFITYAPAPNLNGGYTIFGEVIEGMDVVQSLTPRNPNEGFGLIKGDKLINVTIEIR